MRKRTFCIKCWAVIPGNRIAYALTTGGWLCEQCFYDDQVLERRAEEVQRRG